MKILVTGASGFIAGYLVAELLDAGYEVVGLDNFSKYGRVEKSYDRHPKYSLVCGDAKDADLLKSLLRDCDHFVAGAAMIGGISYFHAFAYDLLAENERITAAAFDAAIDALHNAKLKKITIISSSMVFESTNEFPLRRGRNDAVLLLNQPMDFKSFRLNISRKGHSSNTDCRSRSRGRLTASESVSAKPSATPRS